MTGLSPVWHKAAGPLPTDVLSNAPAPVPVSGLSNISLTAVAYLYNNSFKLCPLTPFPNGTFCLWTVSHTWQRLDACQVFATCKTGVEDREERKQIRVQNLLTSDIVLSVLSRL